MFFCDIVKIFDVTRVFLEFVPFIPELSILELKGYFIKLNTRFFIF